MQTGYAIKSVSQDHIKQAQAYQNQLTKPAGSLGQLETIATRVAGMQATLKPSIQSPWISIFAADHGVTDMGVSAFPAVVTQEMVKNFSAGGAAITVLAKSLNAEFEVVDVGVINDISPLPNLVSARVASGTQNIAEAPAMTLAQCKQAMQAGVQAVHRALAQQADIFVGGEMGIGNTTAATAIIAQLSSSPVDQIDEKIVGKIVGLGTGIDDTQKQHKIKVIEQALARHLTSESNPQDPLTILASLGGFEIAALTGAYLEAGQQGLPVVVDGVIASAAAWVAVLLAPALKDWLFFGHASLEPAQQAVFKALSVTPLLQLNMRLGEGSGAAMAVPIIQLACQLHANMATFDEALVSESIAK